MPDYSPGVMLGVLKRELFADNLLVRICFIIVMIRWTGLVPWEFEFPFPGRLTSAFFVVCYTVQVRQLW